MSGLPEENPPVFKSWNGWYWLVMIVLLVQVLLYFFLTRSFS